MSSRLTIIALTLSACIWAGAEAQTDQPSNGLLRPGDAIRITTWRQQELSGQFNVNEDGTVAHPIFQGVVVTGVPLSIVRSRVEAVLRKFDANPQFVIEPLLKVIVGGQVRQPSLYRLPPEMTVAEAIGMAGGITERGRLESVRLYRRGIEVKMDLREPQMGAPHSPIESGDQIFVDGRVSFLREYVVPAGSITGALVAIIGLIIRN